MTFLAGASVPDVRDTQPEAVEYPNMYLEADRVWYTEFPEQKDGMWSPYLDKPGLGLELDPYAVEEWSV